MELHVDYLMNVLPIVGTGMLGVFLVTGVIIAGVSLLNALTSKKRKIMTGVRHSPDPLSVTS